jgi:hypothetical protein
MLLECIAPARCTRRARGARLGQQASIAAAGSPARLAARGARADAHHRVGSHVARSLAVGGLGELPSRPSMTTVSHPLLGAIDPSGPGFWDATLSFAERDVMLDLTVEGSELTAAELEDVLKKAADLRGLDKRARKAIASDAEGDEEAAAALYVSLHRDELSDEQLQQLFGTTDRKAVTPDALLSKLHVVRVGLYPENEDGQILLDYSLGEDVTNYLLCVSFDAEGDVAAVDLES